MNIPRVVVAGLCGGSGKTILSVGLTSALRRRGLRVVPFKKGPDYIDAAWLTEAAGCPCRNLDLFLMPPERAVRSFFLAAEAATSAPAEAAQGPAAVALVEGNRGLYDGVDARGTYSTAELAKQIEAPVILAVDCTKSTRTVAAVVLGCQKLDPNVPLRGVVLNQIAGARHESVLRQAIEEICGLPVVGALPKIRKTLLPQRHLGLVPPEEHGELSRAVEQVAAVAEQFLDVEAILRLAQEAPPLEVRRECPPGAVESRPQTIRVGVFRDAAFQFYYPENLEALAREGAHLVEISPLRDTEFPRVDALYAGGGFPETLAARLAENGPFLSSLRRSVEAGLPVYAECGGAVFLGEKLVVDEHAYPMAGVLPVVFGFQAKPQGHGYTVVEAVEANPFYRVGDTLRGHEFHYTYLASASADLRFAFRVRRGHGFDGRHDGLCHRNVLAFYTHVHALGTEQWAPSVVRAAEKYRESG